VLWGHPTVRWRAWLAISREVTRLSSTLRATPIDGISRRFGVRRHSFCVNPAIRMCDGRMLISDQYVSPVIESDRKGDTLFSYAHIGNGSNRLDAPYDGREIGDYVGATPPFGSFFGKH
jgi:hypothetical protein